MKKRLTGASSIPNGSTFSRWRSRKYKYSPPPDVARLRGVHGYLNGKPINNGELAERYCSVLGFVTSETKINMQYDWHVPHPCQRHNSGHISYYWYCIVYSLPYISCIYTYHIYTFFSTYLVFGGTSANITQNARLHGHLLTNGWLPDCLPISSLGFNLEPAFDICSVAVGDPLDLLSPFLKLSMLQWKKSLHFFFF